MSLRWGVLGAGGIVGMATGGALALAAAAGAEWVAIAARDPERAGDLARRHGVPRVHLTYADLVADPDVDAVYVALANDAHLPWTLAALRAGKHVLCEKPLGLSASEVGEMHAAASEAGRLCVEASWYRWHPRVRLAQRLLAEGAVGAVRHVAAGFTFGGVSAGNYRLDPARGGGALYDVGCYAVSAALWAFGTPPREVSAQCTLGPTGVDLAAALLVEFDGGTAEVQVGIDESSGQWLVITGDAGEVELRDAPFTSWLGQDRELLLSRGSGTERIGVPAEDAYRVMVEEVSSAASGGAGWVLPLAESLDCARVLDAAFESAAAGTPVAL